MSKFDFSKEREQTNKELASEIATLTALTARQVEKLLPKKADKKRLQELIGIVNGAAADNRKLAQLRKRWADVGGVALKVLKTVVSAKRI